jgi:hypothetical protein
VIRSAMLALAATLIASSPFATGSSSAGPAAPSTLRVVPNGVRITESFRGAPLVISAEIPIGAGAAVEIVGEARMQSLLIKGRRGGLWMNVGQVTVQGAPSLYFLMTTKNHVPSISVTGSPIGYPALFKKVEFSPANNHQEKTLFEELVKLKEHEGLFAVLPDSLQTTGGSQAAQKVQGQIRVPGNIAPGTYEVSLSVFNDGKLLERRTTRFSVKMAGLTAILLSLAHEHKMVYGLLAIVIAIATGFAMGLLFKSKGAH